MIQSIVNWSAKNKLIILILTLLIVGFGVLSLKKIPLDAIPDLSDTQVILYTDWAGRSPDLVENQITYPLTSALLSAPKVKAVRGMSFLGSSFIYVIFEEGTDIYWARSRVNEYIQSVKNKLPSGVNPVLGPDATSLGWGFSYSLIDTTGKYNLAQLRSLQDYYVKLSLESVQGVSQVASVGGYVKQYQVSVYPQKLISYKLAINDVMEAIQKNNDDGEGRVLEMSGLEYMIRGKGYLKGLKDLENIAVGVNDSGTPILLKDIGHVQLEPDIRRGVIDINGQGDAASGIVIVRFGENMLSVIDRVKKRIQTDIEPSLPPGVKLVVTYDRSDLIKRSIHTLTEEIIKLSVAVSVICLIFLWHLPSALIIILTLPIAILCSFILMFYLKISSNIMSLSGIAIAIGAMVDASIIMVENVHKKLEHWQKDSEGKNRTEVIVEAIKEVAPSLFFSLLVITIAFLPVFALNGQAGRLFKPLAYTKTFVMFFASILAITLTPVLILFLLKGKIPKEETNPVNNVLINKYEPLVKKCLKYRKTTFAVALGLLLLTIFPFINIGKEFMPPLNEGTVFYMPVTAPGISITEAQRVLKIQDKLLKTIPEVDLVFGKAGRAETATDPAPLEMMETVINLKPEDQWRKGLTIEDLVSEMNEKLTIPGVANSFTMPIKARIDMLATGIRTPLGIKVMGDDIEKVEQLGLEVEKKLKELDQTRSAYAERVNTGYYLDIQIKREAIARYNLSVADIQDVVQIGLGGMPLTTLYENRERYSINMRFARDYRDNIEAIKELLVAVPLSMAEGMGSGQVPLKDLAEIRVVKGPTGIRSEDGLLVAYVYIDTKSSDLQGYINQAKPQLKNIKVPPGYRLQWSGEYENMMQTRQNLLIMVPVTLILIFFLLYLNTKEITKAIIIMLAIPFSLIGSFWLLYWMGYNISTAVWVGLIAMAGLDAETGIIMLLYLELSLASWKKAGKIHNEEDLKSSILEGAVKRIRPKIMTISVILVGLIPIMFSSGAGSDVMKRIATPMVGGVVTSALLELLIYPTFYFWWKRRDPSVFAKGKDTSPW